jgi:hypothetical protein
MDQCDDCGEVVCASCSTLLSCKFCGGGLCEECATACGRYVTVFGRILGWKDFVFYRIVFYRILVTATSLTI